MLTTVVEVTSAATGTAATSTTATSTTAAATTNLAAHAAAVAALPMWKGHGTENDFLVIDDRTDTVELSGELVALLCDRRAGIGGDGVLRVVGIPDAGSPARFFMDYRNADGSVAEMCGNGARVFARYLHAAGLEPGPDLVMATRAGDVEARLHDDGEVTVSIGPAGYLDATPEVVVEGMARAQAGIAVSMPNPHVVVLLDEPAQLTALELTRPPQVMPLLPEGQNVEFVVALGERHLGMRVHERGSGETRSCGTGIAAAVLAAQRNHGYDQHQWRVDVPGGTVFVRRAGIDRVELTGPAVIVGRVTLDLDWLIRALDRMQPSAK